MQNCIMLTEKIHKCLTYANFKATSKTWTWTLDLDLEKHGPWKTWTQKNMDPKNPVT